MALLRQLRFVPNWRCTSFLSVIVAAFILALTAGCGGRSGNAADSPRLVSPAEFAAAVAEPERVTINVHVPDEGSIAGTDLSLPFDMIEARAGELPADRSTPLAVYCRSGSMSATAVATLAGLGYTSVVELEGGMLAWEAEDRPILAPGSS
jgi:rhodanese-related sulfurtransferase